jgi:hypothetical protein
MGSEPLRGATGRGRWGRLFGVAVPAALAIGAFLVLKEYTWAIPRSVRQRVSGWFLEALLLAHGALLVLAPLGVVILTGLLLRARRRRERRPALARALLLCASCLLGLGMVEAAAAAWQAWAHRSPKLPETFTKPRPKALPDLPVEFAGAAPRDAGEVEIVVLGESSAKGEPYGDPDPPWTSWLSIGEIVGWQLGRAIPGRRFHVTILAKGGDTLERQHQKLAGLKRRPDLLIVYAGHNEFHSRFNWERVVPPERPAPASREPTRRGAGLSTPLGRMIREAIARNGVEVAPPAQVTRRLVDWPVCTRAERAEILADFERRVEAITQYAERVGALPVLVIPPGNDAGYEPNRSVAVAPLTEPQIKAVIREFNAAKAAEDDDPSRSLAFYRAFLVKQPLFAEAHYRVARLLERSGDYEGANHEYVLARDLDGFPQRCPSDLQDTYRAVAARHPAALLVDGQSVLRALSRHGILDDHLFHDAQHPVLIGHVALAQAVLDGLRARRAFGWSGGAPAARIDPAECAEHFGMSLNRWAVVCGRVVFFYKRTAYLRHDPAHRLAIIARYEQAAREIRAGKTPEETGVPGLGVRPAR